MYGSIYVIVNNINEKVYVGQTTRTFKERYPKGLISTKNCHLKRAVEMYGEENFDVFENYYEAESKEDLDDAEVRLIKILDTTNPERGYNIMSGGHNGKPNEEVRRKIGEANSRREYLRGKDSPLWTRVRTTCCICGKPIDVMRCFFFGEKYKHFYCSDECREAGKRLPKPETRKRVNVNCAFCGKEFELRPSEVSGKKNLYCSRECCNAHQRELLKGENNPNYGNHKMAGGANGRALRVRCVETGEEFDCARDADKKYGLRLGSVSSACRGEQHTAAGLHWERV